MLRLVTPLEQLAADGEVRSSLEAARGTLDRVRARRPPALRDEKILTAWNGLALSALARAGFVLEREDYLAAARRTATFLLDELRVDGRLRRSHHEGQARHDGYLDDYVMLIAGLLDLYESTGEIGWLTHAVELQQTLDRDFWDADVGGYYMTSDDHEPLLARDKPAYDGAMPSGNAVGLWNLVRLHALTLDDAYRARGARLLAAFARTLAAQPGAVSEMLLAVQFELADPLEIVIVTSESRAEADPYLDVLRRRYQPFAVLAVTVDGARREAESRRLPPLVGKTARNGSTTAYVCRRAVCRLPAGDVEAFVSELDRALGDEGPPTLKK
ncbi:MAG TPA: hypothetical protein VD788_09110 [Candidatus Polarisedimenticolaceae bacterium]|nr:hypothetical protein [Candidatus Polarisedimenticolaceae bacterium]